VGAGGNLVTLQFVNSGNHVPDAQAVLGAGTDAITIDISGPVSQYYQGIRTLQGLSNLVTLTSIPTLDGGYLTTSAITGDPYSQLSPTGATAFSGGYGPASNTTFQVENFPIVDGTNGGVPLTAPSPAISALVNGVPAVISAVNGPQGQFTLASPVATGATLTVTYYYNTWANTFDLLPSANVASIIQVGLGPNRSDYTQDIDYTLGVALDKLGNVVANTVNWGNNVSEAVGVDASGDTPFSPSEVLTTLVDENVWLRPLAGVTNGRNSVFTLPDTPTDGTGVGRPTDNPAHISVYVGTNPFEAFQNGAVPVAALSGVAQRVTLFNPPAGGTSVWASYYRNTLEDQQYTVTVVTPGFSGLGTYTVQDNLGRYMPLVTFNALSSAVSQAGAFAATGVVYPFGTPDYVDDNGSPTETVTLTFRNDGNSVTVPAVAASLTTSLGSTGSITFQASLPGVAGNAVQIALDAVSTNAQPVVVAGNLVTIYANWNGTLSTITQIAGYFPSAKTTDGGQISVLAFTPGTGPATTAAQSFTNGADQIDTPVSLSYTVSSNLNLNTPPAGSGSVTANGANIGYLDQTYVDPATGFRITVVNPADHVAYGVLTIPQTYNFTPGDKLVFNVVQNGARYVGNPAILPAVPNSQVAIFGLTTKVVTTLGATTGDTVIIDTVRGSGNEPAVGSYYYVTFTTNKTAQDYALKMYTNPSDAYANYGQPSTINRLSLGIQLMAQNGVQTFGAIQVPVVPGTNYASSADFIAALAQLKQNLPGLNRKADVVIPLSNDPTVHQALSQQLTTLATARYKGEGIGFVGYSQFTTYQQAIANANSLLSQRMIAIGNAAAGILITNLTTGVSVEYLVDGPFMAAALAGLNCNPSNDVATTLTLQNLTGFSRLLITYDDPTMDLMAANGLTMLLNNNGSLLVRHYKTTNPQNTLVSEPTSTTIADFVAQTFRSTLQQFIGRKLVDALVTDITVVCNSLLKNLVDGQIISGYESLAVVQNPNDPTEVDVTVTFKPIFSLLYLSVTFTVQTSL
jgi:hypothetical protein